MSNPRSDIMGEMQRLPMNHKEGDKGLGIPKGRRTKAVLDPICSKIGISKTNMQEILKMLAIFQAPGKTIFQGSMQEKSFVSSFVASLYKIRKVRAKKLLNRLDTNCWSSSSLPRDGPWAFGSLGIGGKIILATVVKEHYPPHDIQRPEKKEMGHSIWRMVTWFIMTLVTPMQRL